MSHGGESSSQARRRKKKKLPPLREREGPIIRTVDEDGFINQEARMWAMEVQNDSVNTGRPVKFDLLHAYNLGPLFEGIGLKDFMELRVEWYDDLVKRFYANMQLRGNHIYTVVDNTVFNITTDYISTWFNLPNSGLSFTDKTFQALGFDLEDASMALYGVPWERTFSNVDPMTFIPQCRLMAKILAHNLFPQRGHFHQIKYDICKVMYALKRGINLNFAEAVFLEMRDNREALPYGMALTYLFHAEIMDLDNEAPGRSPFPFNLTTLREMDLPLCPDEDYISSPSTRLIGVPEETTGDAFVDDRVREVEFKIDDLREETVQGFAEVHEHLQQSEARSDARFDQLMGMFQTHMNLSEQQHNTTHQLLYQYQVDLLQYNQQLQDYHLEDINERERYNQELRDLLQQHFPPPPEDD